MGRRLFLVALAAAGAAAALAAARKAGAHEPSGNGGSQERAERLRRELDASRRRLRTELARARAKR